MPTKRPRHMVTETADLEQALAPLRERGVKIDLRRLLILGAKVQMAQIDQQNDDDAARRARQTAAMARARDLIDVDRLLNDEAWR